MLKISILSHSRRRNFIGLHSGTMLHVVKCCQLAFFCNLFTEGGSSRLKHSGNNFNQIHIGCVIEVWLMLQRTTDLMDNGLIWHATEVPFRAFDCCIGQGTQS